MGLHHVMVIHDLNRLMGWAPWLRKPRFEILAPGTTLVLMWRTLRLPPWIAAALALGVQCWDWTLKKGDWAIEHHDWTKDWEQFKFLGQAVDCWWIPLNSWFVINVVSLFQLTCNYLTEPSSITDDDPWPWFAQQIRQVWGCTSRCRGSPRRCWGRD